MSKHPIKKIAIVGLGSIGRRHLRILKKLSPTTDVILVRSGNGGEWPEEALAKRTFRSVEEAINEGVDAAIIASPAPDHLNSALEFIESYIPVLIEKPLSHNMNNVAELHNIQKDNSVPVLIGYVLRYSKSLQYFHELVMSGKVGKPLFANIECGSYLPDWRPEQDYKETASAKHQLGGGVLLELSHELDYANWLFGPFVNIKANLRNSGSLGIEVEDIAQMLLTTAAGYTVTINLDFCRRNKSRSCTFFGADGTIFWDGIHNTVTFQPATGKVEKKRFNIQRDAMFRSQLKHFISCIEQTESPKVSINDGIITLKLIDAAKRSNESCEVILL